MAITVIEAKKIALFVDGVMVGCAGTVSLNIDRTMNTTTCIDSGEADEFTPGTYSSSIDFDGTMRKVTGADITTQKGYVDFTDLILEGKKVDWVFGTTEEGDTVYTGSGYVMNLQQSGSATDAGKYSGSIQNSGPVVKAANPVTP